MNDLVTWLRTQLDEDERVARAATEGPWSVDDENYAETIYAADGHTTVVAGGRWGGEASVFAETTDALHIARFNPARVLAEVAAKRQIVGEHDPDWPRLECPTCCGYDGNDNYGVERRPREAYPCRVVRLLAVPLADQPGYRAEWRLA